jgi:type IV pilus assembly protein PilC
MQGLNYFPQFMIQMVKIGEESGMLGGLLNKLADIYESDIDHLARQFSQLLEPLIILVLGVLIGGLVIGMYLPIFKLGAIL